MAQADSGHPLQELARAADTAAARCDRMWRIGHELAKELTANGRSMMPEEVALVEGLERSLDWSDEPAGNFRPWWLDEATKIAETHDHGPTVWAEVADSAQYPAVVAQLSDLLWVERHPAPHIHARRAIDAYLVWASELAEPHDASRALRRAHDLAGSINDRERVRAAEIRLFEATESALTADDLGVAIALLEHVSARRLTSDGAEGLERLQDRAWDTATRPDLIERVAKLLLRRIDDPAERTEIATRVVEAHRAAARQQNGFGRLVALREALRVAEELGHPAHREILHEIETLDSTSAFNPIRSEHVLSRAVVSDFCAQVVAADSLENALTRFCLQLPINPAAVRQIRENTQVGIRHLVTSVRIGEANSVVTSTETGAPDEDPLAVAVERDVLHQTGYQAQMMSFLLLVPALHQVLDSYQPWSVAELRVWLEKGPADPVVADALARGLEHFRNRRYDEAAHVTIPRIERLVRHIARSCGVATTKRPSKRVGGIRGLGEVFNDLRGDGTDPILPEPLLTACELTLVEPDSLNLRNDVLHGISDEVRACDAALVLQIGLALALGIRLGPEERRATE